MQDDADYADYEAIGGLNLYAYCNNNPVMHSDPSGNSWKSFWQGVRNVFQKVGDFVKGLFGYELRDSFGMDSSHNIATGFFGRIGLFSYDTTVQGREGLLYAFAGKTKDVINWFGKTYYAGVGINLFNAVGLEVQVEAIGLGIKANIGRWSIGVNVNLIGETSIAFSRDTNLENDVVNTKGFTVGLNTGFLVAIICWIYKFMSTGDSIPMPGLQPT